jgi:uroporphyrinogen-III synthase
VVLNTRPLGQSAELSRLLRLASFEVVEAPAIAIVSAWDPAELESVRLAMPSFAWVVLAGQNAAQGLEDELLHARVVCGAATASILGLNPTLALTRFSAAAAIEALRDHVTPAQRILVPRAAEGRDELVDGLRALGATVDAPVAYRTVAVSDAADRLQRGDIDIVTLCSPSAVTSVRRAVTHEVVVCLGKTTASAARDAGLRVGAIAAATSMASLVDAVRLAMEARV